MNITTFIKALDLFKKAGGEVTVEERRNLIFFKKTYFTFRFGENEPLVIEGDVLVESARIRALTVEWMAAVVCNRARVA